MGDGVATEFGDRSSLELPGRSRPRPSSSPCDADATSSVEASLEDLALTERGGLLLPYLRFSMTLKYVKLEK